MSRYLLGSFILFAIIFILTIPVQPYPGSIAVKAVPAVCLALFCLLKVKGLRGRLLFLAFLLCASGDAVLSLDSGRHFIAGLVLFLLAQLTFLATFAMDFGPRRGNIPVAAILIVYAAVMGAILKPYLADMAIPVFVYLTVITAMSVTAALRAPANGRILVGAVVFVVSDSIIAVNKFAAPVPGADYFVMITYYAALFLIATGFIRERT